MGNPLIWLSGAQRTILAECPTERPKYTGIGSAILITSAVAAVSMTFALHTALKAPLGLAVPLALGWGLAIMGLDRWLVVSLVRDENRWNYLRLAIPRLFLALLFGAIISTPVVLMVFRSEIAAEIPIVQQQNTAAGYQQADSNSIHKKIVFDIQRVQSLRDQINSGGQQASNSPLNTQLKRWKKARNRAIINANFQQSKGNHKGYLHFYGLWVSDENQVNKLNQELTSSASEAVSIAQAQLPVAKAQLNADEKRESLFLGQLSHASSANNGILIRLQALDELANKNSTVWWAKLILFLFFTAIECLPIFVKVLTNLGPASAYDKMLAQEEELQASVAAHRRAFRKKKGFLEGEALSRDADRLLDAMNVATPAIDREAVTAANRVARARLRDWEMREMQEMANRRVKPRPQILIRLRLLWGQFRERWAQVTARLGLRSEQSP